MKLQGTEISGVYVETCVIPRPSTFEKGEDGTVTEVPHAHVFKLAAVLSYDDFDKVCKRPEPPMMILKGGAQVPNLESKEYAAAFADYGSKRFTWAFLKSISATEGLEWSKVKMGDPSTWHLYRDELREAGFSQVEVDRLAQAFAIANCLDEVKLEEARKSFLSRAKGQ